MSGKLPPPTWVIGFYDIGNFSDCIYACCCPWCAMANARSTLDGSSCLFNFCNVHPVATTHLFRSAHGIPEACFIDCLLISCGCLPCRANQVYQTSLKRPSPKNRRRSNEINIDAPFSCKTYSYALCCSCCALSTDIQRNTGMPFCGSCCFLSPIAQYNIMRYQYTIDGSDDCGECYIPCLMSFLSGILFSSLGLFYCAGLISLPYQAYFVHKMITYLDQNGRQNTTAYLEE
eukprot:gene7945-16273_t